MADHANEDAAALNLSIQSNQRTPTFATAEALIAHFKSKFVGEGQQVQDLRGPDGAVFGFRHLDTIEDNDQVVGFQRHVLTDRYQYAIVVAGKPSVLTDALAMTILNSFQPR